MKKIILGLIVSLVSLCTVKDGGMSVFNALDLQKNGVKTQLGYYISKDFVVDVSYAQNTYVVYALIDEAKNEIYAASVNYRF